MQITTNQVRMYLVTNASAQFRKNFITMRCGTDGLAADGGNANTTAHPVNNGDYYADILDTFSKQISVELVSVGNNGENGKNDKNGDDGDETKSPYDKLDNSNVIASEDENDGDDEEDVLKKVLECVQEMNKAPQIN